MKVSPQHPKNIFQIVIISFQRNLREDGITLPAIHNQLCLVPQIPRYSQVILNRWYFWEQFCNGQPQLIPTTAALLQEVLLKRTTETGGNLPKPPNKLSIRQHHERTGNVTYRPILPVTQNLTKSFITEANKNGFIQGIKSMSCHSYAGLTLGITEVFCGTDDRLHAVLQIP